MWPGKYCGTIHWTMMAGRSSWLVTGTPTRRNIPICTYAIISEARPTISTRSAWISSSRPMASPTFYELTKIRTLASPSIITAKPSPYSARPNIAANSTRPPSSSSRTAKLDHYKFKMNDNTIELEQFQARFVISMPYVKTKSRRWIRLIN